MERRRMLQTVAGALTVGLAGCGGDESGDDDGGSGDSGGGGATATATQTATQTSTATATETETPTATQTTTATQTATADEQTATATATETGPQTQVVRVGPDGSFRFRPGSFTIAVGETVRWEWEGDNHNVTPDDIPTNSSWQGTTADDQYTYDAGYTYSHTFEVAGEYTYFCDPHRSAGMTGSFTVTE